MVIKPKEKVDLCGPNSKHVQLISVDDHVFIVKRKYAMVFESLKKAIIRNYLQNHSNVTRVDITARLLIVMCRFLEHYFKYGRYTTAFKLPSGNLIENLDCTKEAKFVYFKFACYIKTKINMRYST